jgi:hypothetical protein
MHNEDIINLIATNGSAAEISDSIKSALFAKAAERVDSALPLVASNMFDGGNVEGVEGR